MKLTIVVPAFNAESTLAETLRSILRANVRPEHEVIIVDDGSEDDTAAIASRFVSGQAHWRLVRHEQNRGGGAARNTGVRNSSGEYLVVLDSDDLLATGQLEKLLDRSVRTSAPVCTTGRHTSFRTRQRG